MARGCVVMTIAYYYDIDPDNYDEGMTPQEMMDYDAKSYAEDPYLLLDWITPGESDVKIETKGYVLPD